MGQTLTIDIVTPEALLFSQDVEMAVIPGKEGDFGVLGGHAPLISSLRAGVVRLHKDEKKCSDRVFVSGGFVEVTSDRCTILATEAFDFANTSRAAIEARHEAARKAHEKVQSENEKKMAEDELNLAQAMLENFIENVER